MDKTKKSILTAVAALTQMLVTSLVGLVLNKTIISNYGSEYNGINSTVSQIVSTLMILEGGFSLASNVALFDPFGKKEYKVVNGILSATRNRFLFVGGVAFFIGLILTFVYPFSVSSVMPKWMIAGLMLTALIPASYNLAFNMKYRVLILTDQKEYVISFLTAITYLFGNGIAIILIRNGYSILVARFLIMLFLLINYYVIELYCKKKYNFACYNVTPNYQAIKGTKSVIILKLTSVLYYSVPIILISTIPEKGTLLASVYAVYKSIIAVAKDSLTSVTNAPRLAFGALFSEGREEETKKYFNQYEMLTCIGTSTIIGTTCLLLLPFVELYTKGVQDVQYKDVILAIIMLSTVVLEIVHIPSGQIIQMKGEFTAARKIQSIACIILVLCMIVGYVTFGLYGIVTAILIGALSLTIMEISYTSVRILKRSIFSIIKNIIPCFAICSIAVYIGLFKFIIIDNYITFILVGITSVVCIGTASFGVYYILDNKSIKSLLLMFRSMIIR